MKKILLIAFVFGAMTFNSCIKQDENTVFMSEKEMIEYYQKLKDEEEVKFAEYLKKENITVEPSATGLYKIVSKEGEGEVAEGKNVRVHYTGMLLDGTIFDSSIKRNTPFTFQLGKNTVIPGWEEGIATMKKGEKARFIMPSSLGYGAKGAGNSIPPYSSLIFDVEMIDFQ